MRVWHGPPTRSARPGTGRASTSRSSRRSPRRSRSACSTARRRGERVALPASTGGVWHGYFPDLRPGQLYGLRRRRSVRPGGRGALQPEQAAVRPVREGRRPRPALRRLRCTATRSARRSTICSFDTRDSAAFAPLATVVDPAFTWGADVRPRRALADTRDLRAARQGLHPAASRRARGAARHLRRARLARRGRAPRSTWASPRSSCCRCTTASASGSSSTQGCRTTGATTRSASSRPTRGWRPPPTRWPSCREFKTMVATLHDADIAVLLDVVYNHTAEGSQMVPTLAFRGLDNAAYYHLADDRRYTFDVTGTGNTLNLGHPRTLQLIIDSLRYWVSRDARRRVPVRPGAGAGPRRSATTTSSRPSSTCCCRTRRWPTCT